MARSSHRGGADPGTVRSAELLTTGGLDSCLVDWGYYRHGYRQEHIPYADAVDLARRGDGLVWIGLLEPTENQVALLGEEFSLHPLAVEDAVKAHQRPKLERYAAASDGTGLGNSGDTLFAVFKTVRYVPHTRLTETSEVIESGDVTVFCGAGFVITVRHGQHGALTGPSCTSAWSSTPPSAGAGPTPSQG